MKIDYKIVIPSYNRSELIKNYTLNFLETSNLLEKSEIFIFTPQVDEYCESLKYYPINILPCPVGLINARNYIKDYFPEDSLLLILDDDVKGVSYDKDLHTEIINSFKFMLSKNITLGSINPTGNSYFKSNEYKLGLYLCVGCFFFEINKKTNYLENLFFESEKEDYIRTLKHYQSDGTESADQSKAFRKNYPSVGWKYDVSGDGFYNPDKPFTSWVLDSTTFLWVAPVAYPTITTYADGAEEYIISWDETNLRWTAVDTEDPQGSFNWDATNLNWVAV